MIDRQCDLAALGEAFTPAEALHFATYWPYHARPGQLAPYGDWSVWLLLGGRGAGKTRTGAEWIMQQVRDGARSVALVAPTLHDAREVMLGGSSGLLSIGHPSEQPSFQPTRRRLLWPNGAVGYLFSAEEPDRLRGPQFDCAWADEFCAWPRMADALSNLRLSLRLGPKPRLVVSTTPRPVRALDDLMAAPDVVVTRARTIDNAAHLSPDFVRAMQRAYGGTALGRQELDGEIVRDHPHAIFSRDQIASHRVAAPPKLSRIIVAVDPPATSGPNAARCGIIVAGRVGDEAGEGDDARAYILHDGSLARARPEDWARRAVSLYHQFGADAVLAETNQGGEMVSAMLRQIDPNVPILTRHARRSKAGRAAPVGLLYSRGRVHHVGRMDALEDELCAFGGPHQQGSPDRMDALVWAVAELLLGTNGPRVWAI